MAGGTVAGGAVAGGTVAGGAVAGGLVVGVDAAGATVVELLVAVFAELFFFDPAVAATATITISATAAISQVHHCL